MLYWGIILFICIIVFAISLKALLGQYTLSCKHTSYWNSSSYYCIGNAFNYLRV